MASGSGTVTITPVSERAWTPFPQFTGAVAAVQVVDGTNETAANDTEYIELFRFTDPAVIPLGSTISSVTVRATHSSSSSGKFRGRTGIRSRDDLTSSVGSFDGHAADTIPTAETEYTVVYAVNPISTIAWTVADIFTTYDFVYENDVVSAAPAATLSLNQFAITIAYSYNTSPSWWYFAPDECRDLPQGASGCSALAWYRYSVDEPTTVGDNLTDGDFGDASSIAGRRRRTRIIERRVVRRWRLATTGDPGVTASAPDPHGWWLSTGDDFTGAATIVGSGRPGNPRSVTEIAAFATGNASMLGGFPGPSCVFENYLVYAPGGYTVGTSYPTVRVWDGTSDRILGTVPPTSAGAVPKAVLSMLAANGTIYVSTFDSGASSADWAGRVFSIDLETGVWTPIGAVFSGGHLPYALAWSLGRLWVGSNKGDGTAGRVYFIRPVIDTAFTQDRDLGTDSVGGVCSMLDYEGKLYVGSDAALATFAKVLVRDTLGAYTTSLTATGGAAKVNNGFLSMLEFGGNLYSGYWNEDATAVAKIYKFDNTTWTAAYTGSAGTLRPFIGLVSVNSKIYAIGGGRLLTAILLSSSDGATWTDLTAFLTMGGTTYTAYPVFGVINY